MEIKYTSYTIIQEQMYLRRTAVSQCRDAYRYRCTCTTFVRSILKKPFYEIIPDFIEVFS
jgi:hypothetical protein